MPLSFVVTEAGTLVASSVRITSAEAITPPEESVITPVSCAVYVDCARRDGENIKANRNARDAMKREEDKFRIRNCMNTPGGQSSGLPIFRELTTTFA